jgi:hypothetical protein
MVKLSKENGATFVWCRFFMRAKASVFDGEYNAWPLFERHRSQTLGSHHLKRGMMDDVTIPIKQIVHVKES